MASFEERLASVVEGFPVLYNKTLTDFRIEAKRKTHGMKWLSNLAWQQVSNQHLGRVNMSIMKFRDVFHA